MALSPRLESLGLRPLQAVDAAELHALVEASRDYLSRWLPWAAGQELKDTEAFIAETEAQLARNDGFQAAIAPDGPINGVVGFHSVDWTNRNTTIGYWLAEKAQGRGIMTTAVGALVDHAFGEWNLHRIEIHCTLPTTAAAPSPSASASAKKRRCARRSSSAVATSTASSMDCLILSEERILKRSPSSWY
ncbi:MAG TPA: GNAT family N-acetyltransferase [Solirubrobacterales bacterium]|nr:GNAT family N-acetyltransferase [Solirubrobacterales bacterium]